MVKRIVRWIGISLLIVFAVAAAFAVFLAKTPVPFHEFETTWYHTPLQVTEVAAATFCAQHRSAVLRAQCDHFVRPVGPGRVITLLGATLPDDSGDVFLFFGSAFVSSDAALHLLPVYCWSEREKRLLWKGLQDNSP
jgi:hypothetical protein